MAKAPAAILAIQGRPDPQKRPQHMQGEQADPACHMNRILMRVIAVLGDFVRDVVDGDNAVEKNQGDKQQDV